MHTANLPTLPAAHFAPEDICLSAAPFLHAHRSPAVAEETDTIFLITSGRLAAVSMHLTPAIVVALANELLTDAERAAITFTPALAGGHTE